jgi:hypothetical protein
MRIERSWGRVERRTETWGEEEKGKGKDPRCENRHLGHPQAKKKTESKAPRFHRKHRPPRPALPASDVGSGTAYQVSEVYFVGRLKM